MPHDTVYITDVENEVLSVFIKRKVLDNPTIIATLEQLIFKLEDDMKAQLKRTRRIGANPGLPMDDKFVRGSIREMPKVGDSFIFYMDRLGKGWVTTSPVKSVQREGRTYTIETENSTYILVKGWGTDNENV